MKEGTREGKPAWFKRMMLCTVFGIMWMIVVVNSAPSRGNA